MGETEQEKAVCHHGGDALPFALASSSQSDNLMPSILYIVRFGSIAAYVCTWAGTQEKGQALTHRDVLSAGGMVYSVQQIGICRNREMA